MAGNFAGVSFPIEDGSKMPAIASMCYFTTQKKKAVVTHLTCDDDPKVNHARGT